MKKQRLLHQFTTPILDWFKQHGRKDLPWQKPRHAYRVWVSEIMLQQTQVQTVIDYFNRFITRFPTIQDLAQANDDEVLSLWSGLGYYSRARNLHKTAKIITEEWLGCFPQDLQSLIQLPGIGPSTAAAILSQAFNLPHAILDANVKRVLMRFFMIEGRPEQSQVNKQLWQLADLCMPKDQCADYTQAIMDLGAMCCTAAKPDCTNCPVHTHCLAFKHNQQLNYPNKKIKKPIPKQQQQFLVLINQEGHIYLEKRPPAGIWGGLWCLPSIDTGICPLDYIRYNFDLLGEEPELLVKMNHRFSHFQLEIEAVSIRTRCLGSMVVESSGKWFESSQFDSLGLAKPTKVILDLC